MAEGRLRLQGAISCKRGDRVRLGQGVFISAGCELVDDGIITLGDDVILGPGVRIIAEEGHDVTIEAGAWIGENAALRPGAHVGAGAMVCGESVVQGDVPANAVVEGRPAKVTWYLR